MALFITVLLNPETNNSHEEVCELHIYQWSKLEFFLTSPNPCIFNYLPKFSTSPTYIGYGFRREKLLARNPLASVGLSG